MRTKKKRSYTRRAKEQLLAVAASPGQNLLGGMQEKLEQAQMRLRAAIEEASAAEARVSECRSRLAVIEEELWQACQQIIG